MNIPVYRNVSKCRNTRQIKIKVLLTNFNIVYYIALPGNKDVYTKLHKNLFI